MSTPNSKRGRAATIRPATPSDEVRTLASTPLPRLDETDLRILEQLMVDARASQRSLARSVGMSPPAVAERIARLEASGVITGYRACVDWSALQRGMTVTIELVSERSADQRELAQALLDIPEVEEVDIVTGGVDLRLRLRVRDHDHFRDLFFSELMALPGVLHTNTSIVMATVEQENYGLGVIRSLLTEVRPEQEAVDG